MRLAVCGVALLALLGAGCAPLLRVEVRPAECLNPPDGDCIGGSHESRLIEVRLYQLKKEIDPCALDHILFREGKDADALKGALVESQRGDAARWVFKVSPGEQRVVGTWQSLPGATHVLAIAVGHGQGKRSARVVPVKRAARTEKLLVLNLRGYDICFDGPCETSMETKCQ